MSFFSNIYLINCSEKKLYNSVNLIMLIFHKKFYSVYLLLPLQLNYFIYQTIKHFLSKLIAKVKVILPFYKTIVIPFK